MEGMDLGGMMGGGGGGPTSKEFGRSSAASNIEGDTVGLVFDQTTIIVIAISSVALVVSLIGLYFLLRRN